MLAHDIIIIDTIPDRIQERFVNQAINYALLSISFTYNRMDLDKLARRIQNIAKGKIAELMFQFFMKENKLEVNFSSCQTPFYLPDKRDFLMGEYEWDIKNNFVRSANVLSLAQIIELPALIPNRPSFGYFMDQWEKRKKMLHSTSNGARYVFTFMERPVRNDFIDIYIHPNLKLFFERIKKEYPFVKKEQAPFTESWFWNEISKVDFPTYKLNQTLRLYVTAWAGESQFKYFYDTKKQNFEGFIFTIIKNKTIKVHRLPSFASLFPKLKEEMNYGRFL